jgi:hypothetical protein
LYNRIRLALDEAHLKVGADIVQNGARGKAGFDVDHGSGRDANFRLNERTSYVVGRQMRTTLVTV